MNWQAFRDSIPPGSGQELRLASETFEEAGLEYLDYGQEQYQGELCAFLTVTNGLDKYRIKGGAKTDTVELWRVIRDSDARDR